MSNYYTIYTIGSFDPADVSYVGVSTNINGFFHAAAKQINRAGIKAHDGADELCCGKKGADESDRPGNMSA